MSRLSNKRKTILGLLIAVAVIVAFGLTLHAVEKRQSVEEGLGDTGDWGKEETVSETHYLNVDGIDYSYEDDLQTYLIIGTDSENTTVNPQGVKGQMADFMTLLLINNTKQTYAFLQLDRNTMTDVPIIDENGENPGEFPEQLCIAQWYGKDVAEGSANTVSAVSTVLGGLPIDGYYTLDMKDIAAVNSAVGGVVVDIDTDLTELDPEFREGASVLLTDQQAERYLRARMDVGDGTNAARMARQRQYMQKLYNLVLSQLRENPDYINDLYDELNDEIESELPASEVSRIANDILQYEAQGILTLSGTTELNTTLDDGEEHEEFYADPVSLAHTLKKMINLTEVDDESGAGVPDWEAAEGEGLSE